MKDKKKKKSKAVFSQKKLNKIAKAEKVRGKRKAMRSLRSASLSSALYRLALGRSYVEHKILTDVADFLEGKREDLTLTKADLEAPNTALSNIVHV